MTGEPEEMIRESSERKEGMDGWMVVVVKEGEKDGGLEAYTGSAFEWSVGRTRKGGSESAVSLTSETQERQKRTTWKTQGFSRSVQSRPVQSIQVGRHQLLQTSIQGRKGKRRCTKTARHHHPHRRRRALSLSLPLSFCFARKCNEIRTGS